MVYAWKILERTCMGSCNPCHTPMESRLKLSKTSTAPSVNDTDYQGLISCLRYLVHTRPDIAFIIGMQSPTTEHLSVVKNIMCYVVGTFDNGCHYRHE
jgi:hypothetical protein